MAASPVAPCGCSQGLTCGCPAARPHSTSRQMAPLSTLLSLRKSRMSCIWPVILVHMHACCGEISSSSKNASGPTCGSADVVSIQHCAGRCKDVCAVRCCGLLLLRLVLQMRRCSLPQRSASGRPCTLSRQIIHDGGGPNRLNVPTAYTAEELRGWQDTPFSHPHVKTPKQHARGPVVYC